MKTPKISFSSKSLAKYVAIFALLLIFCHAKVLNVISPFGWAMAFALIFCGYNTLAVCLSYFVAFIVNNPTFEGLISVAFVCAVMLIWWVCAGAIKKQLPLWAILVVAAFSQIAYMYFGLTTWISFGYSAVSVVLGVLSCYICICSYKALQNKRLCYLSSMQKLCVCISLLYLLLGLANIRIFAIDISCLIFCLLVIASSIAEPKATFAVAAMVTLASVLTGEVSVLAVQYLFYAAICVWLVPVSKFLAASVVCLCRALLGLIVGLWLIDLVPCLVAAIVIVSIPSKYLKKVGEWAFGGKRNLIANYYITQTGDQMKTKLANMAALFDTMAASYRNLTGGAAASGQVVDHLAANLKLEQCSACLNRANCYNGKDMTPSFCGLIDRAVTRGKVTLLDVPTLLATNCVKVPACLAAINSMAQNYAMAQAQAKAEDESKLSASLQLAGTSQIFKQFANGFGKGSNINVKTSKLIKDAILSEGLVCTEAAVLEGVNGLSEILVVVRHPDAVDPRLVKGCQKVVNIDLERKFCVVTKIAGWSMVSFVPMARYELLSGCAATAKTPGSPSGDNYQYNKLDDNNYLFALSDGMGHGGRADNVSNAALDLIGGFYKCGMGGTLATDSVNKLLLPLVDGVFATLDVAVVNVFSGVVDFIKMGSTISVVKSVESSQIIEVESLPLGVAERAAPTTQSVTLQCGDVVVLASDGVVDAFASQTEFCNYVNNLGIINMQFFAENILEEAAGRLTEHKDDMTVLAFRLAKKR